MCSNCGEFADDLHVLIKDPLTGKILYQTRHTCKKCKSRMKQIGEKAFAKYPCPRCRKMGLIESVQLMWD